MNTALVISAAAAFATAIGHSWLGEAKILGPLYENKAASSTLAIAGARRILRAVWHLPSVIWALTGLVTYGFVHHGTTPPVFFMIYGAALYGASALGNFWGLRRLHLGSVLLTVAAVSLVVGTLQ